ncbi:uncharacterized protein EI97DRAFT_503494 [Westerdykella ornata]|uniref:F-box domain-containing protein n=1 Tax=Westerdykella ornata TaxID=318751 RepID=A0A6A6JAX5_WESOR|nr:uncharacterized protein EI97DRAFT_503494 [Westerdykella ornata]KAF2273417.1 hypothetical protein EI97DRAFT_503494 [Westerdykella ornata]
MGSSLSKVRDGAPLRVTAAGACPEGSKSLNNEQYLSFTITIPRPSAWFRPKSFDGRASTASLIPTIFRTVKNAPLPERQAYFRFLDLPLEIRFMIYEEVLVVGKVFYTPTDYDLSNGERCDNYQSFKKPELQLLKVCKRIHAEAEPIYLAKNLFVLPVDWFKHSPFRSPGGTSSSRFLFSEAGLSLIKNVSLGIDFEVCRTSWDKFNNYYWTISRNEWHSFASKRPFAKLTQQEKLEEMHEALEVNRQFDWGFIEDKLSNFRTTLNYVELDFTNIYCLLGECRPMDMVDIGYWISTLDPSTLIVKGLCSRAEREQFIAIARRRGLTHQNLRIQHGLRFVKRSDKSQWDSYMAETPDPSCKDDGESCEGEVDTDEEGMDSDEE